MQCRIDVSGHDSGPTSWRNPWPSAQTPYCDPPWLMRGRSATAWFEAPWDVAASSMSPDLLPNRAPSVRARLRFYDLEFEAASAQTPLLAVRQGRFREGV